MNTFEPYIVESSCILKGGDMADGRMTELNLLIACGKGSDRPPKTLNPARIRVCYFERLEPGRQESGMSGAKKRGRPLGSKNGPKRILEEGLLTHNER